LIIAYFEEEHYFYFSFKNAEEAPGAVTMWEIVDLQEKKNITYINF
jgi:hypothetical protein